MIVEKANRLKNVDEYYFSKKLEQIAVLNTSGKKVINLGIGSPDLLPPDKALAKLNDVAGWPNAHGYSSYRSLPELREAMARWYQEAYELQLHPHKNVLPLLGSKEGILYLSMAILNPGDKVLVPNPGYPAYASAAKLIGAEIIYYDLTDEGDWLPDLNKIEQMDLTNCKLMWINYPHMPTGKSVDQAFFDEMVKFGKKHKILICNDNPYSLVLNTSKPLSLLTSDPDLEVSCELNSMSKAFNMAGWRVGMFLGAPDLVTAVITVKSNVDSGMFLPIQWGAIAALETKEDWHMARNKIYEERRTHVWEIFDLLGLHYKKDQVGLFVWARLPDSVSEVSEFVDKILLEARVFLTPGFIFGTNGKRYVRASLCASVDILVEAKQRIKDYLK